MVDLDNLTKRVKDIEKRHEVILKKRVKLQARLDYLKKELADLGKEIKAAGLDPKNLKDELSKREQKLVLLIQDVESQIANVEEALKAFEEDQDED